MNTIDGMNEIEITFTGHGGDEFKARWKVSSHRPAELWFKLFLIELESDKKYHFRFTGFLNNEKNKSSLLEQLRASISVINKDGRYHIPEWPQDFDQETANKIHHHFEILSGSFDWPSEYWKGSPPEVKEAVSRLNYCIHDLEAYTRNNEHSGTESELNVFSTLVTEIKECRRTIIPGSFYSYFTMKLDFGDMVQHYSQIGKTWLEAFYDDDQEVSADGIRPQYALSGEFDVFFGQLHPDEAYMTRLTTFLESKGKKIDDCTLRLGHLPVAKLDADPLMWKTIKDEIGRRSHISKISAYVQGKKVLQKTFS